MSGSDGVSIPGEWRVSRGDLAEYWSWAAVALYLLLTVDLLTTLYAAAVHGAAAEANPYVRWVIRQDLAVLVGANLLALVVLMALFAAYFRLLRSTSGPVAWVMAKSFELWIGFLVAAGLFVFANNLSVIVLGGSLV